MSRNPLVLQQWLEQLNQWHPAWGPAMGAAIFGFMALWAVEAWYLNRAHDDLLKREQRLELAEDWLRLIRQDIAGVFLSIALANCLLGAIIAVLIFIAVQIFK
jgi:integral membrane sensor domain MASE1